MSTIGFLHTSPVHVPTFDSLTHQARPLFGTIHVVDEALLTRARTEGLESTRAGVRVRLDELNDHGADVICCTCSTVGEIAEQAGLGIPVFRVDRAMACRAVEMGSRIGVVAALESTLEPTRDLISEVAAAAGFEVSIDLVVTGQAWSLFEAGDVDGYIRAVAESAFSLDGQVDVIVLAQASMALAEDRLGGLSTPLLSSPRLAVEHAVQIIDQVAGPTVAGRIHW